METKMFKIEGLDQLTRNLEQAQKAIADMGDELGTVKFNPHDPASIDAAVQEVERLVDERLGAYAANPIIGPMTRGLKEKYREGILDKAAATRNEDHLANGK